ncbi:hypothetical protein [Arthrobacter sp. A2-55]|uniref:hypothetical protein n=1 Tax=Arthrobacter sp. A2-55 TaxID=2897337 RepID=UPI0021CDAC2E|nr:hypothetical protein [Arthrobacter sp. A2-55]MCU6479896.1 hypothetical protein [Arthrobacter sp. A2-55]
MLKQNLEAPGTKEDPDWDSLYRARGDEVSGSRPIFTGDVFTNVSVLGNKGAQITALILQHPCALRIDGVNLVPRLLVAEVQEFDFIPFSQWNGRFKVMPLPVLIGQTNYVAQLHEPHLVEEAALNSATRIASMSQVGVDLLLQRWVHHNSRVVVPTADYQRATVEQFEEADLIEEWCDERAATATDIPAQLEAVHEWMRGESSSPGKRWQDLLQDPQTRGVVRKAMRRHIKELR